MCHTIVSQLFFWMLVCNNFGLYCVQEWYKEEYTRDKKPVCNCTITPHVPMSSCADGA